MIGRLFRRAPVASPAPPSLDPATEQSLADRKAARADRKRAAAKPFVSRLRDDRLWRALHVQPTRF